MRRFLSALKYAPSAPTGGDSETCQVFSVRKGVVYEEFRLTGGAFIKDRAVILKRWLKPLLTELEGLAFCVHLGDRPSDRLIPGIPNLCYCKRSDDSSELKLVPDAHYQLHQGYVPTRKYQKLYKVKWEAKAARAVFRGSCTGEKPLARNLRAQLCALDHKLVDARISRVNDGWTRDEIAHLLGREMSEFRMAHYKYQIDVDGNSSSWCGLFWKLMSGSLTLKMRSEWVQWYYDQLSVGRHYDQFADFDELIDKIKYYIQNDDNAKAIGINAQNFTRGFAVSDQQAFFVKQVRG